MRSPEQTEPPFELKVELTPGEWADRRCVNVLDELVREQFELFPELAYQDELITRMDLPLKRDMLDIRDGVRVTRWSSSRGLVKSIGFDGDAENPYVTVREYSPHPVKMSRKSSLRQTATEHRGTLADLSELQEWLIESQQYLRKRSAA